MSFFETVYEGEVDFDSERFLIEVEAQFTSEDLREEVRWRLDVLKELVVQPDLAEAARGLKNKLTQIFSIGGDEEKILDQLKTVMEIQGRNGERLDLRSFLKRARRKFAEDDYRIILGKKLDNTRNHVVNLVAFYPEAEAELNKLVRSLGEIRAQLDSRAHKVMEIKAREDELRETSTFHIYEDLKSRFLRDWLARFTTLSPAEIKGMAPEELQRLIQEHQRHQLNQLAQHKIALTEIDMTEHLGVHDTLECQFLDMAFWQAASHTVRDGFRHWILGAVQAFGILKGHRFATFQSQTDKDQYLLFGLGISGMPTAPHQPIVMVPYLKPFTRKASYLLEIRRRDIGNLQAYYHELVHYVIPFLYAFNQMKDFKVSTELVEFFNNRYSD
jgi:hypothetical protein